MYYGKYYLSLRAGTKLIASRNCGCQRVDRNPTRSLREKPYLLFVAVHPRQREHAAGAKEARAIDKEEEVRMHRAFRMPLVSVDEIVLAPLGRRDGQDGEIRKAVDFGVQTSLPGVGV